MYNKHAASLPAGSNRSGVIKAVGAMQSFKSKLKPAQQSIPASSEAYEEDDDYENDNFDELTASHAGMSSISQTGTLSAKRMADNLSRSTK